MPIDKIVIKDNGVIKSTIDLRRIVLEGLTPGSHTITVEGYNNDSLVSTESKNILVSTPDFEPEYIEILDFAFANNIPVPDTTQQNLDNQLIVDLKAAGVWDKLDIFFQFKSTAVSAFKSICWKRVLKATPYGSLGWNTTELKGNGFGGYFDPLYNPALDGSRYTLNNASMVFYLTSKTTNNQNYAGVHNGDSSVRWLNYAGTYNLTINGVSGIPGIDAAVGLNALYVTGGVAKAYAGEMYSEVAPNATTGEIPQPTALPSPSVKVLAVGTSNGGTDFFSDAGMSYFLMGDSLEAEHGTLKTLLA